jgi:peptide/nickel transport system substrate-binding protein
MYPFWHSSERNDPGLNVALYANPKVDKLLEDARSTTSNSQRESDYKSFNKEIQNDEPAVFLYAPSFLYMVPKDVKAVTLGELSSSQDRFLGIRNWYIETNNVWKIFVNN